MTKILCWNFEKSFLKREKMVSRKIFWHFLRVNFFMFILLISNHTVFLIQFGVNLHLWVFQKAEITLAKAARAISAFWKTHSCKLIPNWMRKTVWLPILTISYLTITDETSYVHHKFPVSFLLYIATKKTCQINQIFIVNSSMNAPISETSQKKNNSCKSCVPMFLTL